MITINDIALLAGVSKSTVSRVLTNSGYVNEETKKKILEVMEEYGYQPSASARNLSKRLTNTIGVVIPEMWNSFFYEVLSGIAQVVDQNDLTLIYCNTDNNALKEEKALNMLEAQRVRGVILTPAIAYSDPAAAKKLWRMLDKLNAPVVFVDRDVDNSKWDGVFYENFQSAYCATETLIKSGNRTIGIITGDLNLKIARDRYRGYCQAMEDYNIPILEQYIYHSDFSIDTAYNLSSKMFQSNDIPDAIFTCNNQTSLGFIRAVRENKMKLGREIAAIGIDHIDVLDMIDYKFSYVTRDTVEMGCRAMNLLLERLNNPDKERTICVMPYKVVLKGSEKKQ